MRIVIDIDDMAYKFVQNTSFVEDESTLFEQTNADREKTLFLFNILNAIKNGTPLPSVEPERKPGKWIRAIEPNVNAWTGGHTCSECGRACVQMSMNYCANCGAPMEVEK